MLGFAKAFALATFHERVDAARLDERLAKISAMALDGLPDSHPDADPASLGWRAMSLLEQTGHR